MALPSSLPSVCGCQLWAAQFVKCSVHSVWQSPSILPFPPHPAPSSRCFGPVWMEPHDPLFCLNCHSCPFQGVTLGTLELYLLKLEA